MTVATISDVSQSLLLLENSLKQTTVVTTEFLAKNAKNVYWSHLWIKCKGIFEGWITWKHPDVTVFLDFFDFFSSLFCFFWWKGIFSVIYPSVNVIWNVIFLWKFFWVCTCSKLYQFSAMKFLAVIQKWIKSNPSCMKNEQKFLNQLYSVHTIFLRTFFYMKNQYWIFKKLQKFSVLNQIEIIG